MSKKRKNKKIAICTELFSLDGSTLKILIEPINESEFKKNSYLLEITVKKTTELYYILDIIDTDDANITELREQHDKSCFFSVNEKYIYNLNLCAVSLDSRKEFENYIESALFGIENFFERLKKCDIDEERKSYLKRRYIFEEDDFQNNSDSLNMNWYSELNVFDYDLDQIFSIHKLCMNLINIIGKTDDINNIDKIALEGIFVKKCKGKICKVIPNGKIKSILDKPPTIYSDEKTKDIVWNYRTTAEFRINFHFLWDLIKNILALIYVPLILVLLKEGINNKIYLYSVLAVVYVMALFFSNEKQTDRLMHFFSKREKTINYATLFVHGMYVSIFFLIFSIEMIYGLIDSKINLFMYLCSDVLLTFAIAYCGLLFCCGLPCILIKLEYSQFLTENWCCIFSVIKKLIVTFIYLASFVAIFLLLGGDDYIETVTMPPDNFFVYIFLAFMFVIIRIMSVWMKKDKVNENHELGT